MKSIYIGKWIISIKSREVTDDTYLLNRRMSRRFCRKNFTEEQYHNNRIPVIKALRNEHTIRYGNPTTLRETVTFLNAYYSYVPAHIGEEDD